MSVPSWMLLGRPVVHCSEQAALGRRIPDRQTAPYEELCGNCNRIRHSENDG
jgi:hypothetical protein